MTFVITVGPKTFVSKISRNSSLLGHALSVSSGHIPALFIRTSKRPKSRSMEVNASSIEVSDVTSSWMRLADPGWLLALILSSAAVPLERLREPMMTW